MVIYENFQSPTTSNIAPAVHAVETSGYVCAMEVRSRKRYGICGNPSAYYATGGAGNDYDILIGNPHRSALKTWLAELQSLTEVESLNALQAKSVATTPESFEALSIRNAQVAIQQIRTNSHEIIDELDSLIDSLPVLPESLCYLIYSFRITYDKINSVIVTCRRKGCDFAAGNNRKLSHEVLTICAQTLKFMQNFAAKGEVNNTQIEANVRKLKESFGELVDVTIRKECAIVVASLNKKTSQLCLKWSLLALWQLTQNDPYMCRLFIENQNIIRYLLDIVQNYCNVSLQEMHQIKAAALRVLTYLCTNRNAIRQILEEILSNKCLTSMVLAETEEVILRETVTLMMKLTTPFIDQEKAQLEAGETVIDSITGKSLINELVYALVEIAKATSNSQIFLMASAALANISFLNTDILVKQDAPAVVLNASKHLPDPELTLLKDQIITMLANVSKKHPLEVVRSGGLIYLLETLHASPDPETYHDPYDPKGHIRALAQMQHKIAVALAWVSAHKSTAKIIYKLNGVARLTQLCKDPRERYHSDAVLLSSIAALKRISQSIGRSPFKELNATDLIDSKLQSSYLQYSSRGESLV